jgi:hypothetical protein
MRIHPDLLAAADDLAARKGITRTLLFERAINQYIGSMPRTFPNFAMAPFCLRSPAAARSISSQPS